MNEQTIFSAALEQPPFERRAFLDGACGENAAMRERIERLLAAYEKSPNFMGHAAGLLVTTLETPTTCQPGSQIGRYKIREQLGEGGMGVVYVAEQVEPVKRKVALKIVKPGMASKEVVTRFEAERQALAMMEHPNIARVLDGDVTESGQPYFVMELVQGMPITEYCDGQHLSTRERLRLFHAVCRAVHHAHQRGIIHRDLKPSNILVARIDNQAVPKVIDFGVAKAFGQNLIEQSVYTQFSQMVGTPLYMSPEQAELGVVDVDTRSDVYSLGVLLYELLTGNTPFDSETLKQAGFDEMRRIIREEEPPKPSARVSTLRAEALSTVSQRRGSDPRKLSDSLTGELDWLVMKALEKDRNRRYESASALAADVERFLNGEPIEASPPSAMYRFSKYAARHKAALTTAAIVAASLVLGVIGTSWQAWRATTALATAERSKALAEEERANTLKQFRNSQDALAELLTKVSENELLQNPEMQPLRTELVDVARRYYGQLVDDREKDPTLARDLAAAYEQLAEVSSVLGNWAESAEAIQQAIAIRERLARANPTNEDDQHALAATHLAASKYIRVDSIALQHLRKASDVSRTLQNPAYRFTYARSCSALAWKCLRTFLFDKGDSQFRDEAFEYATRAEQSFKRLVEHDPNSTKYTLGLAETQRILAIYFHQLGRDAEGKEYGERSLETVEELIEHNPQDGKSRMQIAEIYMSAGQTPKAVEVLEKLVEERPNIIQYEAQLANAYHALAERERDCDAAEREIAIFRKLFDRYSGNAEFAESVHSRLGESLCTLARNYRYAGKFEQSIASYRDAIAELAKVNSRSKVQEALRKVHAGLGGTYQDAGRLNAALIELKRVVEIDQGLRESSPDNPAFVALEGRDRLRLAYALRQLSRESESLLESHAALKLLTSVFPDSKAPELSMQDIFDGRHAIRQCHTNIGVCLEALGRHDEAAVAYRDAIIADARIVRDVPMSVVTSPNPIYDMFIAADARSQKHTDLVQLFREELEVWQRAEDHSEIDFTCQHRQLDVKLRLAQLLRGADRTDEASDYYRQAQAQLVSSLAAERWRSPQLIAICLHVLQPTERGEGTDSPARDELIETVVSHTVQALEVQREKLKGDPFGDFDRDWDSWGELALSYYRARQWRGAEQDARLAIELAEKNHRRHDQLRKMAPFLLLAGKTGEYHALVSRQLDDAKDWQGDALTDVLQLRLLDPTPATPDELLPVARRAPPAFGTGREHLLNVAYYRIGQPEKAITGLKQELESNMHHGAPLELHLAVAYAIAGEREQAAEWLRKGESKWSSTWSVADRITYEVLRNEALDRLEQADTLDNMPVKRDAPVSSRLSSESLDQLPDD